MNTPDDRPDDPKKGEGSPFYVPPPQPNDERYEPVNLQGPEDGHPPGDLMPPKQEAERRQPVVAKNVKVMLNGKEIATLSDVSFKPALTRDFVLNGKRYILKTVDSIRWCREIIMDFYGCPDEWVDDVVEVALKNVDR